MIIYKIEQLEDTKDLSHVDITSDEEKVFEEIDQTQLILEQNGSYVIGLFTDEYIDFMIFVFRKYNQLKGFFGDRYEEYPLSSDDIKASYEYYINPGFKKYVTHFFLIDGKSTRFYDELYKE